MCTSTLVPISNGGNMDCENIMKQAASIHDLKLPMLLPGITSRPVPTTSRRSNKCS